MKEEEPSQETVSNSASVVPRASLRPQNALFRAKLFLALFVVAFYLAYPFLTLISLREAFLTADQERLEELVDFRSVREHLKAEMDAAMTADLMDKADGSEKVSSSDGWGMAVGMLFGPVFIDRLITPAGVATLLKQSEGKANPDDLKLAGASFRSPFAFRAVLQNGQVIRLELQGVTWRVTELLMQEGGSGDAGGLPLFRETTTAQP